MKQFLVSGMAKLSLITAFLFISYVTIAQNSDSSKRKISVAGTVSITNNGFSYIPSFTLGKPAILGFVAIERKNLIINTELATP